jgi:hypothetical protein
MNNLATGDKLQNMAIVEPLMLDAHKATVYQANIETGSSSSLSADSGFCSLM